MNNSPEFKLALEGSTKIVHELFDSERRRFDHRARRSFYLHRSTGIALILLSASLPFLSGLNYERVRTYLIPGIAFAISALSSIVTFMAYSDSWKGYRSSEIRARYAYTHWEAQMLEAQLAADVQVGLKAVMDATAKFIDAMDGIAAAETQGFFQKVQDGQGALGAHKTS